MIDKHLHRGNTYNYYRVYLYEDMYAVEQLQRQVGQYSSSVVLDYQPVSHEFWYRRDMDSIFLVTFIFVLFGIWTANLITSFVKKGGIFGGLL